MLKSWLSSAMEVGKEEREKEGRAVEVPEKRRLLVVVGTYTIGKERIIKSNVFVFSFSP
jgi:hypothetical protein